MKKLSDKIDVSTILDLIRNEDTHANVSGYRVKISGVRLTTFATKGVDCICCPRKGAFFRVEDNSSGPHLNLYAYNSYGGEALMTRDHIVPRSKGGAETVENMSPMCSRCNRLRGVKPQDQFLEDYKAGRYDVIDGDLHKPKSKKVKSVKGTNLEHGKYVDAHFKQYGIESHLHEVLSGNGVRRKWQQEALRDLCVEKGDSNGMIIMDKLLSSGPAFKSKLNKYYCNKHLGSSGPKSNTAKTSENPVVLLGILSSMTRRYLIKPSDTKKVKLQELLDLLKTKDFK